MTRGSRVLQTTDLLALSASAAEMLKARIAKQTLATGEVSGWHGRFAPGRIGAPGTAVPLRFFLEHGGLDSKTEDQVVQAILNAQYRTGDEDGGWHILSVSTTPSVEGTAPTLESIVGASGKGLREAISRAQLWLEKTTAPGGGWGSTSGNPPRVYTTCAAVSALAKLPAPDKSIINAAAQWLMSTQRANGSWGPAPGEPGTVVHTAMALRALVAARVPLDHQSAKLALDFLQKNWEPDPTAVQQESHDFHVGQSYHRVTAVYDVDAEVVLTTLSLGSNSLGTKLWDAVANWVARNENGQWWQREDDMLTVWTVVPRALASLRLAHQLGPNTAVVRWRKNIVAMSSTRGWGPVVRLSLSALRPSARWQRFSLGFICGIVGVSIIALAVLGKLDLQAAIVGVLLPLVLFVLQLPFPSRSR